VTKHIPANLIPLHHFHPSLTEGPGDNDAKTEVVSYNFSTHNLVTLAVSTVIGFWYFTKKHWVANNLFGLALAINKIERFHLNNVMTGCILLGGFFFYDIFWVFGTNVMVTVAKSVEAPIKLVFPQDLLENGFEALRPRTWPCSVSVTSSFPASSWHYAPLRPIAESKLSLLLLHHLHLIRRRIDLRHRHQALVQARTACVALPRPGLSGSPHLHGLRTW